MKNIDIAGDTLISLSPIADARFPPNEYEHQCNMIIYQGEKCVSGSYKIPNGSLTRDTRPSEYSISKIVDGTTFSLYPWMHSKFGPIWMMASTNSYDLTNCLFMGELTYGEIFMDLLKNYPMFVDKYGIKLTTFDDGVKYFTSSPELSRSFSYTFIMHHHNLQPIGEDGIHYVGSYSLVKYNMIENIYEIPGIQKTPDIDPSKSVYGYILRHPTRPDIILRSPFMDFLRVNIYTLPQGLTHLNRLEFIFMRSYLNPHIREYMRKIYPDVIERYVKYEVFIKEVIDAVVGTLQSSNTMVEFNHKYSKVAARIITENKLEQYLKKVIDSKIYDIICDMVIDPKFSIILTNAYIEC